MIEFLISSYQFQVTKLLHKCNKSSSQSQQCPYSCRGIIYSGISSSFQNGCGSFLTTCRIWYIFYVPDIVKKDNIGKKFTKRINPIMINLKVFIAVSASMLIIHHNHPILLIVTSLDWVNSPAQPFLMKY